MTTRMLPRDEWPRLVGTELESTWKLLLRSPQAEVLAVEDREGHIVGCWALFPVWHVEGIFIAPAHRQRATVARKLLAGIRLLCGKKNIAQVVTGAITPEVESFILRLGGTPLPGAHFAWRV